MEISPVAFLHWHARDSIGELAEDYLKYQYNIGLYRATAEWFLRFSLSLSVICLLIIPCIFAYRLRIYKENYKVGLKMEDFVFYKQLIVSLSQFKKSRQKLFQNFHQRWVIILRFLC